MSPSPLTDRDVLWLLLVCLQAVSHTMQQLLQCLLAQQHLSRIKAALGLLLNCTDAQPDPQQLATTARTSPSSAAVQDTINSSSSSRALQLVQDQLLGFLTPKDLASDELQLPLLAALGQAAQGGGRGGAVQPLAVLLAACCPSARCLDTLANTIQVGVYQDIVEINVCLVHTITAGWLYSCWLRCMGRAAPV
jgi:hypothetical protein